MAVTLNKFSYEESCNGNGNRAIWALLWVLGIPLPILVVAYFLTGGGCGN